LESYEWPGNVREMENAIERAVALTDGDVIDRQDLPSQIGNVSRENEHLPTLHIPDEGLNMAETIAHIEKTLIKQAMDKSRNVKARAATLLNINRTTLVEKIRRYGMN
jgi:DNA-binding NtrC family response regulator